MKRWLQYAVRGEIKTSHALLALPQVLSRSVCLVSPARPSDVICRPLAKCGRVSMDVAPCIARGIRTPLMPILGIATRHVITYSPSAVVASETEVQLPQVIKTGLAVPLVRCASPARRVWPLCLRWGPRSSPFDDLWQEPGTKGRHFIELGQRVLHIFSNRECNLEIGIASLKQLVDNPVRVAFMSRLQAAIEGRAEGVRWGVDWADALRLRAVVHSMGPESKATCDLPIEWSGSLKWLGGRLLEANRRPEMSAVKLPVYATAIASRAGYNAALEWMWRNTDDKTRQRPEVQRSVSLLGLRVILSSALTETALAAVILPVGSDGKVSDCCRWSPPEIAMCAMVNQRREGPLAQLLAKLMTEDFKTRLGTAFPAYSKEMTDRHDIEERLFDRIGNLIKSRWRPWSPTQSYTPKVFNFGSIERLLAAYIGTNDPAILWPLCLALLR